MLRLSNAAVITTNAILALIGLAALSFSVYVYVQGPSQCQRFVQNPLIVTATLLFFISSLGLIAALYGSHIIITLYLFFLFLSILLLLVLSVFIFLVTNPTAGKAFSGKGIGNVKTGDLQNWIGNHFLRGKNWEGITKCLSDSRACKRFGPRDVDFDSKHLSNVQFGCCRPPVECGFESKNATWWTVPATATTAITGDCKTWSNTQSQLCYGCESCKIGVLKGIRKRWRILLVVNLLLILLVVFLYSCGCCVRKNNRVPWKRRFF
ncbi:Tetraspanin/Peripherin [Arabidopsis suecica]|uniref:Tetraspanin/Peripherin n=1 Tax=Arabidopsis suecica TaxID=45249 RepID=A0A8T1ZAJ9_ARASU|nr:Tetraspanin/Peripherin [Arabidopsis suecica]